MQKPKKLLVSLAVISVVVASAVSGTTAYFSDTETSTDNILRAGSLDLQIDNTSYYNGEPSPTTTWEVAANLDDGQGPAEGGKYLFFDFHDLKPGDHGEDTVSIHIDDNPAWVCVDIDLTMNDDDTCTEPESAADADPNCVEGNQDVFDGDLAQELEFVFWGDTNNNSVFDEGEEILTQGMASDILNGVSLPIADSTHSIVVEGETPQPLAGGVPHYVGKAWCFGELTIVEGEFACNGQAASNASQSDVLMGDIAFRAIQSRHNDSFVCAGDAYDYLDIGNTTSESGHDLSGWSDEWVSGGWGGNYGGGSSDSSFRLLMGHGDDLGCDPPAANRAEFVMHAGADVATQLTLEHLSGQVNDSFEVYINGDLVGSYAYDGDPTELWETTTFSFAPVTGEVEVELIATNPDLDWCEQWGQVAFSNATLH